MEEISVRGEKYVKASVLAKNFGYTSDYLGQLCRGEQVKATLVGRSWYINEDSLRKHKQERYRSSSSKSKETLKKMTEEMATQQPAARSAAKNFNYEADESDLLPSLKEKEGNTTDKTVKTTTNTASDSQKLAENVPAYVAVRVLNSSPKKPILRTIPKYTPNKGNLAFKTAPKPAVRPSVPTTRKVSLALLALAVLVTESVLLFGALGLEKRLVVSGENAAAMVLYGFDAGEASRTLVGTFKD